MTPAVGPQTVRHVVPRVPASASALVFDAPRHARTFVEALIGDNLDLASSAMKIVSAAKAMSVAALRAESGTTNRSRVA